MPGSIERGVHAKARRSIAKDAKVSRKGAKEYRKERKEKREGRKDIHFVAGVATGHLYSRSERRKDEIINNRG